MNLIVLFTAAIGFAGEILVGHLVGAGRLHEASPHGAAQPRRSGLGVSFLVATTTCRDRAVDAAPVHAGPGDHRVRRPRCCG
jgi:hypothetical protein